MSALVALGDYVASRRGPCAWLVLPVDMPLLSCETLRRLSRGTGRAVHYAQHPLPLMLRFDADTFAALGTVRASLAAPGGVSVQQLLSCLGAEAISCPDPAGLTNASTPADWQQLATAS